MDTKNNTEPKNMTKEEYIEALRTVEKEKEVKKQTEDEIMKKVAKAVHNAFVFPLIACFLVLVFGLMFGIENIKIFTNIYFFLGNGLFMYYTMIAKREAKKVGMEKNVPFLSFLIMGNLVAFPLFVLFTSMSLG